MLFQSKLYKCMLYINICMQSTRITASYCYVVLKRLRLISGIFFFFDNDLLYIYV